MSVKSFGCKGGRSCAFEFSVKSFCLHLRAMTWPVMKGPYRTRKMRRPVRFLRGCLVAWAQRRRPMPPRDRPSRWSGSAYRCQRAPGATALTSTPCGAAPRERRTEWAPRKWFTGGVRPPPHGVRRRWTRCSRCCRDPEPACAGAHSSSWEGCPARSYRRWRCRSPRFVPSGAWLAFSSGVVHGDIDAAETRLPYRAGFVHRARGAAPLTGIRPAAPGARSSEASAWPTSSRQPEITGRAFPSKGDGRGAAGAGGAPVIGTTGLLMSALLPFHVEHSLSDSHRSAVNPVL